MQPEVEGESPDFVIGEINPEVVQVIKEEPVDYALKIVDETDELIHSNIALDIIGNQTDDIEFSVWLFREDDRQLVTLKSQANTKIAFVLGETEKNRFGLFNGGDLRIPILAEYGNVIEDNKIMDVTSNGNVVNSDSLIWIQNEHLFAAEIIRNQSYSPSGIRTFTTESNFLPFYVDGKTGWIDFSVMLSGSTTIISGIRVNKVVLSKK
ncbi:MAG: hypothetical protein ACMZ7B_02855 [Balneola sp.]